AGVDRPLAARLGIGGGQACAQRGAGQQKVAFLDVHACSPGMMAQASLNARLHAVQKKLHSQMRERQRLATPPFAIFGLVQTGILRLVCSRPMIAASSPHSSTIAPSVSCLMM